MATATEILEELIALPSVNPAFLPANHAYAGETAVANFLSDRAAKSGLDVELQRVIGNRANVVIRYVPGGKVRQRVILAPHMDTVGGEDLVKLTTPLRKGNRLYGRGACDTKGSLAAMFVALARVVKASLRPQRTEIVLAALIDEESAQAGSRALVRSGLRAQLAIVGEPTELKVVTAHKGVLWLELRTSGKAAHGARPELGRNAVHEMAKAVDLVETRYAKQLARRRHRLLGRATVNVGAIRGGTQPNIVPASCTALVDRRTLPGESDGQAIRELKKLFAAGKLRVAIGRSHPAECSALETDSENRWVRQLMDVVGQRVEAGVDYFSDGGVLADGGIASVLYGPGNIAQAHTPDEWVDLRQVERAALLLERFLQLLP